MHWLDLLKTAYGLDVDVIGNAIFLGGVTAAFATWFYILRIPGPIFISLMGAVGVMLVLSGQLPGYFVLVGIVVLGFLVFLAGQRNKQDTP